LETDVPVSLLSYEWSNTEELYKLLESSEFLAFIEKSYNDLISFYNLTNGLNGVVTAEALNTALAYSGSVRHELTLLYEVLKELDDNDTNAFDDFKARKEIEIRKRENRSELAGAKWLSQAEIAKYAKIENYDEYTKLRKIKNSSHNKCRFILRLMDNLKVRSEDLKTISSNARTEMNNLNIDAYALTLEHKAVKDVATKRLLTEGNERRRRR